MSEKEIKIKKGRSAKSGQFVSEEFVKANPETTVVETIVIKRGYSKIDKPLNT